MIIIHPKQFVRATCHNQLVRELFITRKLMCDVIYPGKQADMIFMSSLVSKHFSLSIGFAHTFVLFFPHQKSCAVSLVFLPGRLLWERKTYTKMDQIRFFYSGPKIWSGRLLWERKTYTKMDQFDRSGCVLFFFLTSLSLSMRGRYNNEIAG